VEPGSNPDVRPEEEPGSLLVLALLALIAGGAAGLICAGFRLALEEADRLAPRSIPLGRIAEVEECANLVAYLASPLAHFVNGTMIEIDGGQQKPLMDQARG